MDFYQIAFTRRSIRSFKSDSIPKDVILRILNAARFAPSGSNRQPTRLILINNIKTKEALIPLCANQQFITEAPLIVVAVGKNINFNRGNYMGEMSMLMDAAIAMDHLILAARYEGLGSCWIGAFDNKAIKDLLNIPYEWNVVALAPIGYPKKESFRETAERISLEEFIKNESW